MSAFDARMAALATRQIGAKGTPVQFIAAAADPVYDAATLTVTAAAAAALAVRAVVAPARAAGRNGIEAGDVSFLVAGSMVAAPRIGDTVVHAGKTYRIGAIDTTWAGALAVTHLMTGRAA